jgi:hypothetical protein
VGPGASRARGPRLAGADAPVTTLERLAIPREPASEAAAHATVDTADRSVAEVCTAVLEELARCAA